MSKWIRQMCGFTYLTLQRTSDCRERGASPLAKDDADTGLVQHGEFLGAFVLGKAIRAMELRAVPNRGDLIVAGGNLCGGHVAVWWICYFSGGAGGNFGSLPFRISE